MKKPKKIQLLGLSFEKIKFLLISTTIQIDTFHFFTNEVMREHWWNHLNPIWKVWNNVELSMYRKHLGSSENISDIFKRISNSNFLNKKGTLN
jgi:hypothetical protein